MKETIIRLREFLLAHVSNKKLQSLIIGLLSYEMVYYIFFGAGTFIIDIGIFSLITSYGCTALISNIISTICAIVFAYTTNKLWVKLTDLLKYLQNLCDLLMLDLLL